ncbi:MAG: 2,3-bisphosphoglycerate-independent phosphoglycerate mutase [Thermoplasmata archaeon]
MASHPLAVLVILDGLADRPGPAGADPTPLELAATPHLDRLCREGQFGRVSIAGPGVAPESDAGVLSLLGYDPVQDSPGRGVLEALGAEVPLTPADVAFRLNFATADAEGAILDSRVGRNLTTAETGELARSLTEADLLAPMGIRAEARATVGHRGILWLQPLDGAELSGQVSNSDPFYERTGGMGHARTPTHPHPLLVRPLDGSVAAHRTAEATNRFLKAAGSILAAHPINARRSASGRKVGNALLLRNAGRVPVVRPPSFGALHGLEGTAVTEMPVERGIARLFGLADRFVGPMGPDRDRSLRERAEATRAALGERPFAYVHLKGPDEPGHDGRADLKREVIEDLDRSFFGPFLTGLDARSVRIAVTADHATPATLRGHSDDPVPIVYWGRGVAPSGEPVKFSERSCAERGALGLRPAGHVLRWLLAPEVPAAPAP